MSALRDARLLMVLVAGYPRNPDNNSGHQEGFGYYQLTQRGARRGGGVSQARVAAAHPRR
jgi:choline dehydrogenase